MRYHEPQKRTDQRLKVRAAALVESNHRRLQTMSSEST